MQNRTRLVYCVLSTTACKLIYLTIVRRVGGCGLMWALQQCICQLAFELKAQLVQESILWKMNIQMVSNVQNWYVSMFQYFWQHRYLHHSGTLLFQRHPPCKHFGEQSIFLVAGHPAIDWRRKQQVQMSSQIYLSNVGTVIESECWLISPACLWFWRSPARTFLTLHCPNTKPSPETTTWWQNLQQILLLTSCIEK